jgi:hypothetical protein
MELPEISFFSLRIEAVVRTLAPGEMKVDLRKISKSETGWATEHQETHSSQVHDFSIDCVPCR